MNAPKTELEEIIEGLRQPEKMISPKYFYDERGSQLFDAITHLPEYYPTETELRIMHDNMTELAALVGEQASLIEYGSGSSRKTRALLESLHDLAAYVPVDISADHLYESTTMIRSDFPELEILPVVADFTRPFDLPRPTVSPLRNVVHFRVRRSATSLTRLRWIYSKSCMEKPAKTASFLSAWICRRTHGQSSAPTTTVRASQQSSI